MNSVSPIQTTYSGIKFRSRIEARWAVYFDKAGVAYEYEPEGYCLDGMCYLPDFWLPNMRVWVEIKRGTPICNKDGKFSDDFKKALSLAKESGYPVYWLDGGIPDLNYDVSDRGFPVKTDSFYCLGFQSVTWAIIGDQNDIDQVLECDDRDKWLFNREAMSIARGYRF